MKKISIIIIFLISGVYLQAQFFVGLVYDKETNQSIENAEIILLPEEILTVTNSKGIFTLEGLKYKKYSIIIKHINYVSDTTSVEITRGLVKKEFPLTPIKAYKLDEVVIIDSSISALPYTISKIDNTLLITAVNKDAGEILKTIPNVSGVKRGGTSIDPVIRGFKYNQINTFIDGGIKIEGGCPNRMDPALSHLEPDDISEIEIIKGPHSLRYGPSFGGIIKVKTRNQKPYKDWELHAIAKRGYESNWDGHSEYANINGGNNFIFFNLSGSRKDYDNYIAGNDLLFKTAFKKYGYSAELGIQPWKGHLMSFSYNESFGRNVFYPALPMDEKSDDTRIMSADYVIENLSSKIKKISLNSYYTEVDHLMVNHFRPIADTVMANSFIEARNMGYRAEGEIYINESFNLFIGTDLEAITKDGEREKIMIRQYGTPVKYDNLWKESFIANYGLYSELRLQKLNLDWVFAARLDHNMAKSEDTLKVFNQITDEYIFNKTESEFANFSASVGATKKLSKDYNIQLALGKGTRSPNMLEKYIKVLPVGLDKYDYLGNPQLNPETNYQVDITFNLSLKEHGSISLNGFYSMIDDYIKSEILPPSVITPLSKGALGVKQFANAEDWVIFKGFEMIYQSNKEKNLKEYISIAYTHATDLKAYNIETKTYKKDALPEIPPMKIYALWSYDLFESTLIPEIALNYTFDQNNVSKVFSESKSHDFYVLDMGLKFRYNQNFTIKTGVNNLLNEAYYEHLSRNIIGSTAPFYEIGRSFFVNATLIL